MNLDKIIDAIENQHKVDEQLLEEAKDLHKKFPFTSIFPMVILKGLKESKNVHFEGELRKLAIQVNDRSILEKYLDSKSISSAPKVSIEQEIIEEKPEETSVETIETPNEPKEEVKAVEDTQSEEVEEPKDIIADEQKELKEVEPKLEIVKSPVKEEKSEAIPEEEEPILPEKPKEDSTETSSSINEDELSTELSPETLAIIAEIEKKYGKKEEEEKKSKEEKSEPEVLAKKKEEEQSSTNITAPEEITENQVQEETIEDTQTEEKSEDISIEREVLEIDSKEEDKKKDKKVDSVKKPKEKKKKKEKKKDKVSIDHSLENQISDSPFKFKEFKGEDSEYYHLEVDFSDLEPIEYDDPEMEEDIEKDTYLEIPRKSKRKKKAAKSRLKEKKPKIVSKKIAQPIEIKSIKEEEADSSFDIPVKIEVNTKSEMTFLDWLKANKSAVSAEKNKEDKKKESKTTEIIDKFIEDEPSISQGKKAFFSPTRNAKKSLQDDMEIVSETLADLHVFQGSYKKAKALYQKLILKFPEKKSLFAKKLEEISELEKKNN